MGSVAAGRDMEPTKTSGDQIVSLELYASVSDSEKARLSAFLEGRIAQSGKIRILLFLENYPARDTAESLFEDINFIKVHADKIERMAVVGERAWQDTWIALFGLFGRMETAYFASSDKGKALRWLEE
jgi:hypothetical protein